MYFYMIRLSIISSPSGQINQKSCSLSHQVLKILFLKFSLVLIDSQRMEQFIYIQRLITEIGSHLYILPHCKIWDQIIHLKNISQMLTSVQRQFLLRHICQTLPVYDQISLICTVNPTDNIQKRGLTPLCQVITKKIVNFYNPFSFLFSG